jgi:hypothetical protein
MRDIEYGCSKMTSTKQGHFEEFLKTHLKICGSVMRRDYVAPEYLYFDLNAGPGFARDGAGSPVTFVRQAVQRRIPFQGFFFEDGKKRIESLKVCLAREWSRYPEIRDRLHFIPGDHRITLPRELIPFSDREGLTVNGLAYTDPFGRVHFDALREFVKHPRLSMLDILIHLSATTRKRCLWADHCEERTTIEEELLALGKKTVHIRVPYTNQEWTFAFCTNMDRYPELRDIDFYDIRSPEGRRIMKIITLRKKELRLLGIDKTFPPRTGYLF